MAISIYKNGPMEGLKTYICDSSEDIQNLPTKNIIAGCVAYTVNDKKFYIVNSKGEWKEQVEVKHTGRPYAGEYTVTPSIEPITLSTKDRLMEQDLTIEANHEIEDALLTGNFTSEVYYNGRITSVRDSAFKRVEGIKVLNLPYVSTLSGESFRLMPDVEEIYLPRATGRYYNNAIVGNPNLRILDFGELILTNIINNNPKLEILILRINYVMQESLGLQTINGMGCPLSRDGSGGYVYVPQSLISAYQANANWQQYCNVLEFRPIEGSEYEIEGLESTNNSIQSFSLNSPLNNTSLEDTEELEGEE